MLFKIDFHDWSDPGGRLQYGYVPWDSQIFNIPFYQLKISENDTFSANTLNGLLEFLGEKTGGKCLVFVKVGSAKVMINQLLTDQGFYHVETAIEPYRSLNKFKFERRFDELCLRIAETTDKQKMFALARNAFSVSRFHLDPNIPNERADYRYEYWLENGFQSKDPIYVYESIKDGNLIGFCHLKEVTKDMIDFSLAAVDMKAQKIGLGLFMYGECLKASKNLGYKQITTRISINNIGVLNIYSHLGFLFRNPTSTFHWYPEHLS